MARAVAEGAKTIQGAEVELNCPSSSYGWSGEAPRLVIEIMKNKFQMNVPEPPLQIKYTPDQAGLEKCKELGKRVAERLMQTS